MAADGDVSGPPLGLRQLDSSASPCAAKPKAGGKKHTSKEKLVQHTSAAPAAVCAPILAEEPAVLSLVFSILPATALGRALCVCKSWNDYAKEESLWRKLCVDKWPSTGTPAGVALVDSAGGFQKLFRCRETGVAMPPKSKPRSYLKMRLLRFLVDVTYKGQTMFSKVVEKPQEFMKNNLFEIVIPTPDFLTHTAPSSEIVQRSAAAVDEAITKEYLADLKVDWSVIRIRDHKMVCLMSGQPLGRGGTLCWPDDDEDYYKVEFEQPLILEEREQSIVQMTEGELCSFANISTELVYDDARKLNACLKVKEIQLGIRLGFNEWATMGKALYCLQHLQWK